MFTEQMCRIVEKQERFAAVRGEFFDCTQNGTGLSALGDGNQQIALFHPHFLYLSGTENSVILKRFH